MTRRLNTVDKLCFIMQDTTLISNEKLDLFNIIRVQKTQNYTLLLSQLETILFKRLEILVNKEKNAAVAFSFASNTVVNLETET